MAGQSRDASASGDKMTIQYDANGSLTFDPTMMQVTLDRAGQFYFSADKGTTSTRALITMRGKTAHLNSSGLLATLEPWECLDVMTWVSFNDGSPRKILVGFHCRPS